MVGGRRIEGGAWREAAEMLGPDRGVSPAKLRGSGERDWYGVVRLASIDGKWESGF